MTLPPDVRREAGARIAVDRDEPRAGKFSGCNPRGCIADFDASAAFIEKLKSGQVLHLRGVRASGQAAGFRLPLADFAKANDGPSARQQ